jgi:hypothetical protein
VASPSPCSCALHGLQFQTRLPSIGGLHRQASPRMETLTWKTTSRHTCTGIRGVQRAARSLSRACNVPGPIDLIEHNPVIKCQHCDDVRQYLNSACFLAPLSTAGSQKQVSACAGLRGWIDCGSEVGQSGLTGDSKQEPSRPLDHLGFNHHRQNSRGSGARKVMISRRTHKS